ncbi:MAG: class B sortase [Lachnospiraceae bacterium]|nr:class B sortase [Lachnospiraceae bacterium]
MAEKVKKKAVRKKADAVKTVQTDEAELKAAEEAVLDENDKLTTAQLVIEMVRKVVFCAALGAFAYAATGLAIYGWDYYSIQREYEQVEKEGGVVISTETKPVNQNTGESEPEETVTDAQGEVIVINPVNKETVPKIQFSVDEEYFKSVNSDYVCYLYIPGSNNDTTIKYPVVLGEDNEHYLRYTYRNTESMAGSICFDYRTNREDPLGSFSSVIWGHDRKDGSMFGALLNYKNEEYFREYPYVYIYMGGNIYVYEMFSFCQHPANGYIFSPYASYDMVMETINSLNWYDTNVEVTEEDRLLTLYTCTEDATERYIVNAILRDVYAAN